MYIDYMKDDLKKIAKFEIEELGHKLNELNRAKRLCDEAGKEVVAEFGFKGSLKVVRRQLFNLRKRYMTEGLSDSDRLILKKRWKRYCKYMDQNAKDPYRSQAKELIGKNMDKAVKLLGLKKKRDNEIHKRKECLCYTNVIGETNVKRT